jgi:flagellar hook-length control protein FliK
MKVQMALNPKALGEVDVTIINRGNNLHVSITSNTNTMTLFTQNQAEFKNSLVNMGFTNLEMNFSDQRQSNNEQSKNSSSANKDFFEEVEEETNTSIELIVPQYV